MQIYWQGYSSIRIESKQGDTSCILMTDPFENEAAIRFPRTIEPDVLLCSNQDRKMFNLEGVAGTPFVISDPGEYEIRGVFINGIQDPKIGNTPLRPVIYRIEVEDMTVVFLGQLKRQLSDTELDALGNVDILILPVGGDGAMDAKMAANIISTVEPRIVIPIYYHVPGLKTKLGTVEQFCSAIGACQRQNVNKLKITKKELPAEDLLVVVVDRT